eukprot:TRINITY_DN52944_c0_g1_i1.p1 TRINITY_DN52944_c0_g1~~TRINITY_DN52944_c0_g1_i1.p1  ORF type:complete len:446 (-),score=38.60 TRINITY_DN52944_c0_g1_i1:183-1520(-)
MAMETDYEGVEFPTDVISVIYSFCDPATVCRGAAVCTDWYNAQAEQYDYVWKVMTLERWGFASDRPKDMPYKLYYGAKHLRKVKWEKGRPADFKMMPLRGHKNYINCTLLYDPLVFSGSADGTAKIWKRTGTTFSDMYTLEHGSLVTALEYYDEKWLYSGDSNGIVHLWEVDSGKQLFAVQHSTAAAKVAINSIVVDEDSEVVLSAGEDGSVVVWDDSLKNRQAELQHTSHGGIAAPILYLECAWDKKQQVVSVSRADVFVWDTRSAKKALHHYSHAPQDISCASWNYTSDLLVFGTNSGVIHIFNTKTGVEEIHQNGGHGKITAIKIKGERIAAGTSSGICLLFTYRPGSLHLTSKQLQGHTGAITDVALDDIKVISGSVDGCSMVHSAMNGDKMFALLGGSMVPRDNDPPHPLKPWISSVKFDDVQLLAARNSMMRVYHFDLH